MNVQRIELELSKETIPGQSVRIGQGDSNGTTIEAHVYDNGVAVNLGEMTASFCMRTPSGNAYVRDSSCTVSGNVVTYVVDESKCCAVSGKTRDAYFELSSDPYTYSTSRFLLVIMDDVSNGSDPAATWDSEFDKWMARKDDEYDQTIADKLEAVDEALDAMGDISELAVPTMSASTKGGAKLGTGLEVDQDNRLNVTPASTSSLGGVKADGETITADADGTIHNAYEYTLPTMGANTKGGAKLGTGLNVDQNGALNVNAASASALGGVKPDGTTITADNDGTIHGAYQYTLPTMTDEVRGGAKVGDGLEVDQDERLNLLPPTADNIGGVKLEEHGGLALRDGSIGIGSLVQESDGYARGGLAEVTAKGHAEQVSTTGKNLIGGTLDWIKGQNTSGTWSGNVYTYLGLTFTVNSDGSVTVNGTATAVAQLWYGNVAITSGTAYTLSDGAGISDAYTRISGSGKGVYTYQLNTNTSDHTTSLVPSASYDGWCDIRIGNGKTVNNLTFYPQLELGSTATSYEPYTGGAPSPSPDYPQEIRVVRGRNLLDASNFYRKNCLIGADGTETENTYYDIYHDILIDPLKSYYLSSKRGAGNQSDSVRIAYYNGSTFLSRTTSTGSVLSIPPNATKLRLCYSSLKDSASEMLDVQLNLGSTPQPYVPYGHVGLEVRGRNMIDVSAWEQGEINHSTGQPQGNSSASRTPNFGRMLPNEQYVLSGFASTSTYVRLFFYTSTLAYISTSLVQANGTPFTSPSTTAFFKAHCATSGLGTQAQLEKGSTPHAYQPYCDSTTPIPLPSKGFAGALPDGTADSLRLDGAGKCEWELEDAETTTAATDGVTGTIGVDVLSTTGQIADGATVLYKLATPIIEDCGYVDMPAIPSNATVTIPEFDALGIRYFVDDTVTQYGREVIARGQHDLSETNGEIDTLEASIAPVELVVATSNHAVGDYFMLGNVLMRTTTAIATGETINASNATPATVQGQIDTIRDSLDTFSKVDVQRVEFLRQNVGTTEERVGIRFFYSSTQFVGLTFYKNHPAGSRFGYWDIADGDWSWMM